MTSEAGEAALWAPGRREASPWLTFLTGRRVLALLFAYFALQVVIRVAISPSADLDESEQFIFCQKLSWGYGAEPPLYTWIQWLVCAVLGQTVLALSLVKNALLFCTCCFIYGSARRITGNELCGAGAALSLFFLPQFAWESQRDLTHSVLSATLAAATLYSFVRLHQDRKLIWYLFFGACAGLGFISKYNYVFWPVGLVLAALSLPQFRESVLDKRMLLSLVICFVVFLPNALWMLDHRELALRTSSKFEIRETLSYGHAVARGVGNIVLATVSFLGPIGLIYWLIFVRGRGGLTSNVENASAAYVKLICRALLLIGIMLVFLVMCFHATGFRERWFQPILICVPVLAVALVQKRFEPERVKWLGGVAFAVLLTVMIVMPVRVIFAEALGREQPLNLPYAELASQMRPALPSSTILVTDSRVLAGNLHATLREKTVVTPELVPLFQNAEQHIVLVWDARRRELPPDRMLAWSRSVAALDPRQVKPNYYSAPCKYCPTRQMRLGVMQVK